LWLNISRDCCEKVIEENAHIGITFDGDGDRVIFIDEKGEIVDGDIIMGICAIYMKNNNLLSKPAMYQQC